MRFGLIIIIIIIYRLNHQPVKVLVMWANYRHDSCEVDSRCRRPECRKTMSSTRYAKLSTKNLLGSNNNLIYYPTMLCTLICSRLYIAKSKPSNTYSYLDLLGVVWPFFKVPEDTKHVMLAVNSASQSSKYKKMCPTNQRANHFEWWFLWDCASHLMPKTSLTYLEYDVYVIVCVVIKYIHLLRNVIVLNRIVIRYRFTGQTCCAAHTIITVIQQYCVSLQFACISSGIVRIRPGSEKIENRITHAAPHSKR